MVWFYSIQAKGNDLLLYGAVFMRLLIWRGRESINQKKTMWQSIKDRKYILCVNISIKPQIVYICANILTKFVISSFIYIWLSKVNHYKAKPTVNIIKCLIIYIIVIAWYTSCCPKWKWFFLYLFLPALC